MVWTPEKEREREIKGKEKPNTQKERLQGQYWSVARVFEGVYVKQHRHMVHKFRLATSPPGPAAYDSSEIRVYICCASSGGSVREQKLARSGHDGLQRSRERGRPARHSFHAILLLEFFHESSP